MSSVKEIKRKIKSIKSTKQITKAMELVATSKMKKAVDNAVNLRAYGYLSMQVLAQLREYEELHVFLKPRPVNKILYVVFSTDKGLCSALNANICRKLLLVIKKNEEKYPQAQQFFITSGRKGANFLHRLGKNIVMAFPAYSLNPKFSDISAMHRTIIQGFIKGDYDKVILVYPDFVSMLNQKPVEKTVLPFSFAVFQEMLEELGGKFRAMIKTDNKKLQYQLEPSIPYILDKIVPRLIEMQLYQAVLETTASEHSARMVAMQNANQAAEDLLDDLTLTYNQERQTNITAEMSEISTSSAAVG